MATLNAVLVPAKVLKGGRHKIRIAVAHNGQTRYIVTDIIVDSDKEFRNGAIVKRPDAAYLNTKLRRLLQSYQEEIDNLEYANGLSCAEVLLAIKTTGNNKHRTLESVCEEYISNRRIKPSSAFLYRQAWRHLARYLKPECLVENVTYSTIMHLEKTLTTKGYKPSTIKNRLSFLKSVLTYAKRCGYAEFRVDPFANYSMPSTEPREAWLSVDDIRKIRDAEIKRVPFQKCRDIFMLSYYLGGINIADLIKIDFRECRKNIKYIRRKTELVPKLNKYVEFSIPDEAKPLIKKLTGRDGRIELSESQRRRGLNCFFARGMARLREELGLPNLIYYSARKSFAQHALELGVKESVIDYILGHTLKKPGNILYHYIYVTPEMATNAIRHVLDNLK